MVRCVNSENSVRQGLLQVHKGQALLSCTACSTIKISWLYILFHHQDLLGVQLVSPPIKISQLYSLLHHQDLSIVQPVSTPRSLSCTACFNTKISQLYILFHHQDLLGVQLVSPPIKWISQLYSLFQHQNLSVVQPVSTPRSLSCTACFTTKISQLYNLFHHQNLSVVQPVSPPRSLSCTACFDTKIKMALLKNYNVTEEFRVKFRHFKPKDSESPERYLTRIETYCESWLATAEVKTYGCLKPVSSPKWMSTACFTRWMSTACFFTKTDHLGGKTSCTTEQSIVHYVCVPC